LKGKSVSVSVSGLQELDANLGLLSKATARNVLRRVLMSAGQPIADTAAALSPDDPRTNAPDLHTSIIVSSKLKNEVGKAEYAQTMADGGSKAEALDALRDARRAAAGEGSFAEVYVGPDARAFYAHLVEFGTDHSAPQPFLRPAFDREKGKALDIIKAQLGGEIDKAVARMRRRQAKKAAGK